MELAKREGLQGDSGLLEALMDLIKVCRHSVSGMGMDVSAKRILAQATKSEKAILRVEGRK